MARYLTKAENVANYFLSKESMTNKKLQKIVYYAYCWTLTILNNPEEIMSTELEKNFANKLFSEEIEGWVHGPVIPKLYHEYKKYGWSKIPKEELKKDYSDEIKNIFDMVWDIYGEYDGDELENITHREKPWKKSRVGVGKFEPSNNKISDDHIYNYYSKYIIESLEDES